MHAKPISEVSVDKVESLAQKAAIPFYEIAPLYSGTQSSSEEIMRGFCALAATVGRLSVRREIGYHDAAAILGKVTQLIESCPTDAFKGWMQLRSDSDFAIGRDFICFQRQFGRDFQSGVQAIMTGFKEAVATRLGLSTFDVYADAMSDRPAPISLARASIRPPLRSVEAQ